MESSGSIIERSFLSPRGGSAPSFDEEQAQIKRRISRLRLKLNVAQQKYVDALAKAEQQERRHKHRVENSQIDDLSCHICLLDIDAATEAFAEMPCCAASIHINCIKQVVTRRELRRNCCFCQRELNEELTAIVSHSISILKYVYSFTEQVMHACTKHDWQSKKDEEAILRALDQNI